MPDLQSPLELLRADASRDRVIDQSVVGLAPIVLELFEEVHRRISVLDPAIRLQDSAISLDRRRLACTVQAEFEFAQGRNALQRICIAMAILPSLNIGVITISPKCIYLKLHIRPYTAESFRKAASACGSGDLLKTQ